MSLCIRGGFSFSASKKTLGGSELGHFELHCEYCLSHSPPAPPLSCQALSLSPLLWLSCSSQTFALTSPLFSLLPPILFFLLSKIFPPHRTPPTSLKRHTHTHLSKNQSPPISLSGTLPFPHWSPSCIFSPFIPSLTFSKLSHVDLIIEANAARIQRL